jgi:hypothetical protein
MTKARRGGTLRLPRKLTLTQVIAQREYQLVTSGGRKATVVARFGRPRPLPGGAGPESYCVFRIDGLDGPGTLGKPQFSPGVDSVQALFVAMQMAWIHLFSSDAYREGRLRFWGVPVLGLPPLEVRMTKRPVPARPRRSSRGQARRRASP